jgi:ribosomal protein L14
VAIAGTIVLHNGEEIRGTRVAGPVAERISDAHTSGLRERSANERVANDPRERAMR